MMRRRRKSRNPAPEEESCQDEEYVRKLEDTEERFRKILNPAESYVMGIQSVLVWENTKYSAVVFAVVNVLFWLATRTRFYHLVGLTGLLVVFTDMWTSKIWPEIRVPPPPNADNEEWTPVHPRLLSVPELSRLIAYYWVKVFATINWIIHLRKTSHFKFFVLMVLILTGSAVLGTYISGIMLCYLTVMGTFTIPAVIYHNIMPQAMEHIQPFILKIDTFFNVKRVKTKKGKRKVREHVRDDDSDSSDADIREFVPSPVPTIMRPHDDDSVIENAGLLTPDSFSPSREVSDFDSNDEDFSFARGLRSMPGIDDTQLDESHSETGSRLEVPDMELEASDISESEQDLTLPAEDPDKDREEAKPEPMQFVPSHFKEPTPSESDEEAEAKGLKFPDFHDVDGPEEQAAAQGGLLAAVASQLPAAVTAELMSQTVSNIMSSTVAGLSKLGQSMSAPKQEQPRAKRPMTESAESDIMAEFEFLDEEDLELDTQPNSGPK